MCFKQSIILLIILTTMSCASITGVNEAVGETGRYCFIDDDVLSHEEQICTYYCQHSDNLNQSLWRLKKNCNCVSPNPKYKRLRMDFSLVRLGNITKDAQTCGKFCAIVELTYKANEQSHGSDHQCCCEQSDSNKAERHQNHKYAVNSKQSHQSSERQKSESGTSSASAEKKLHCLIEDDLLNHGQEICANFCQHISPLNASDPLQTVRGWTENQFCQCNLSTNFFDSWYKGHFDFGNLTKYAPKCETYCLTLDLAYEPKKIGHGSQNECCCNEMHSSHDYEKVDSSLSLSKESQWQSSESSQSKGLKRGHQHREHVKESRQSNERRRQPSNSKEKSILQQKRVAKKMLKKPPRTTTKRYRRQVEIRPI